MTLVTNSHGSQTEAIEDIAYLTRSVHRVEVLEALTEGPKYRSDLPALTGVSRSTIRRTIREFESRNWIRRDGHQYETTQLGAIVSQALGELLARVELERSLREVWEWLPDERDGFTVEMCADAVVTVAEPTDPYAPISRFETLLEDTETFRFVGADVALFEPCKDLLRSRILEGMETTVVDPPDAANYIRETHASHCVEPLESEYLEVFVHDALPDYGIGLFDDRIAISCHEGETGTVRTLIDTDCVATCEWAESQYARYKAEARPFTAQIVE